MEPRTGLETSEEKKKSFACAGKRMSNRRYAFRSLFTIPTYIPFAALHSFSQLSQVNDELVSEVWTDF